MFALYTIVTALCILALTALFLWLSVQVVMLRQKHKVLVGDGGHPPLALAQRLHGNFIEYVPIALILFFATGGPNWVRIIMMLGLIAFTAGRFLHAFMFGDAAKLGQGRLIGMLITWVCIGLFAFMFFIAMLMRL